VNIGRRVRHIREDLGMSQAELARRAGVARNTIVLIEAGKRRPSVRLLEKIARELRTEPADLVRERDPTQIQTWEDILLLMLYVFKERGEGAPAASREEHLAAPPETSPFAGLEEDRHGAEATRWIDYLDQVTDRWLPQLWRARPPVEEGLPLEEVRQISREATGLARLYIERRSAVRRGCSADQREALDNLEEVLEQVLNLSATQFEERFQQRQHDQQGIPNLTEMRKEQEERKATAAVFHHVRHREDSA
jgi:transcriptional regulator with XRE-family HTH domain